MTGFDLHNIALVDAASEIAAENSIPPNMLIET